MTTAHLGIQGRVEIFYYILGMIELASAAAILNNIFHAFGNVPCAKESGLRVCTR